MVTVFVTCNVELFRLLVNDGGTFNALEIAWYPELVGNEKNSDEISAMKIDFLYKSLSSFCNTVLQMDIEIILNGESRCKVERIYEKLCEHQVDQGKILMISHERSLSGSLRADSLKPFEDLTFVLTISAIDLSFLSPDHLRLPAPGPTDLADPDLAAHHDFAMVSGRGDRISCFKVILAKRSPVFRAMLANKEFLEAKSGEVRIDEFDSATLDYFWQFLLRGVVYIEGSQFDVGKDENTKMEVLRNLYKLADKYDVKDMAAKVNMALLSMCNFYPEDQDGYSTNFKLREVALESGANEAGEFILSQTFKQTESDPVLPGMCELIILARDLEDKKWLRRAINDMEEFSSDHRAPTAIHLAKVFRELNKMESKVYLVLAIKACKAWGHFNGSTLREFFQELNGETDLVEFVKEILDIYEE